ncbi:RNA polymerase I-specific transcription initiation factor RRN3-like [Ylistrum balloti]|uniref:RNA polymerase I-specific transcription initiation factor RRN3-like n=1 Tax=Ylistrum balloti TaxID=509963 RepID=UPI002905D94E|nr:RNA polymerase I-specific transcription initiation factor RRN3-like [Ylistrum balloti]XP_060063403.1 RNA polymerase I-specific transcription initiation factor RRN3-like [Ylistrum balloti]XP_060063404.1 RNA polymerase I-specific transcription initiation factor RRN3-like [Ylistrum balloti]
MSSEHQIPQLENILKDHKRGFRHEYDIFLSRLGDPNIASAQLKGYIQSLRDCITLLDKDNEILVGVLLKVDWMRKEPDVVLEYQTLLHNLVSAHTYYLRAGLRMLVKYFLPKISENSKNSSTDNVVIDSQQLQDHEKSFINVHLVIKAISNIVPMSPTVLMPLLSDYFPYMTKDTYLQECYVKNLLQITHYMPKQRPAILELIVDRMLKLDVRSPKHEIAEAEETGEEDNIIFDMDEPCTTQEVLSPDAGYRSGYFEKETAKPMNHKEAERLDVMMDLVLKYIQQICFHEGQLKWEAAKTLYRELLLVFDRLILPTHASCHVQFIMFSLCAIKQPICEGFLDFLWKKVQDPNTQGVYRQASVSYIGSLLSRGLFVPISTVTACLGLMCDWVHKYLDQVNMDCVHADVCHHGPFYSVCQTIFYVFVFRSKELFEMKKGYKWAEGLNFQRIVTSRLNPLRVCLPVIVKSFASVTRTHQLAFCDTIIEKNNRCFLPSSSGGTGDLLNDAFPFDPYILHRSRKFIEPHYREYQGNVVQEDNDSEDEEDDFITDDIVSAKNSIPVLSAGKASADFMAYSVSPGFKQTQDWPQSMEG